MNASWLIPLMLLVPILGAFCTLLPTPWFDQRRNIWAWSLVSTLVTLAISLLVALQFNWNVTDPTQVTYQLSGEAAWVPGFGLTFGWGLDSIAMLLVLLTTVLMPIVILGSYSAVSERLREYYFWLLLIEAAMIGVFVATDIIFFYVCFEFTLVPLYFLIGVFGSRERLRAAAMFFLYTFTGSMLTLAGVIYVAWWNTTLGNPWSFNIPTLIEAAQQMSFTQQAWVLAALLAGFAVKVPLWPVHTWLPLAHTEAPTAGSVILAGVLLKLGTYGLLRFALPMTPDAIVAFAPWIGAFAVVGILYTALVCWVQRDIKKLIAYSSVSHLGFCVLGLFAINAAGDPIGPVGSVMYMINHGFSTGALFLCVGMIYERFHTREMPLMSGLGRVMPVWSFFMGFFVMASVGLPGLNGFVGEFLTLMGAFVSTEVLGPWFAAAAAFGLIFGAIYLLYMVGAVIFGPTKLPTDHADDEHHEPVKDLNAREIATLVPLAAACLFLGIYPYPVLQTLEAPVAAMTAPAEHAIRMAAGDKAPKPGQSEAASAAPGIGEVELRILDLKFEAPAGTIAAMSASPTSPTVEAETP